LERTCGGRGARVPVCCQSQAVEATHREAREAWQRWSQAEIAPSAAWTSQGVAGAAAPPRRARRSQRVRAARPTGRIGCGQRCAALSLPRHWHCAFADSRRSASCSHVARPPGAPLLGGRCIANDTCAKARQPRQQQTKLQAAMNGPSSPTRRRCGRRPSPPLENAREWSGCFGGRACVTKKEGCGRPCQEPSRRYIATTHTVHTVHACKQTSTRRRKPPPLRQQQAQPHSSPAMTRQRPRRAARCSVCAPVTSAVYRGQPPPRPLRRTLAPRRVTHGMPCPACPSLQTPILVRAESLGATTLPWALNPSRSQNSVLSLPALLALSPMMSSRLNSSSRST
jgi:hypothetical protein